MTRVFAGRTIWLIRHGESTWNERGRAQGHNDEAELTDRGRLQARAVAEEFRDRWVAAVYVSDLRRATQTARPLGSLLGLPLRTDTRLRERSLGCLEGAPIAEVGPEDTGIVAGMITDLDARPAGGESIRDLYLRAAQAVEDLSARATWGAIPRGDIVIVAHGGTLRVLHAYLNGVPAEHMSWMPVPNGAVLRVTGPDQPQ